jgi:HlyD family secretion protein
MKKWIIVGLAGMALLYAYFAFFNLRAVLSYGVVKPKIVQNIVVDFPARIAAVHVQNGQRVTAGEVLVSLDLEEFEAQIRKKEQELKDARNDLQRERAALRQLEADRGEAEAVLDQSRRKLRDRERLFEQGAVSEYELDQFRETVRTDQKELLKITLAWRAGTQGIANLEVKQDKIAGLEQELQAMQNKLRLSCVKDGKIVAPFSNGVVADLNYSPGDRTYDDQDQPKILSVLDLNSLYVEVPVPENMIKYVNKGAEVELALISDPRKKYRGTVSGISEMAVTRNGETLFPVEVRVLNRDGSLLPNLNVDARIRKKRLF